jgi:hypothetical protein
VNTANGAAFDPFVAIDNAPDQAADDRQLRRTPRPLRRRVSCIDIVTATEMRGDEE